MRFSKVHQLSGNAGELSDVSGCADGTYSRSSRRVTSKILRRRSSPKTGPTSRRFSATATQPSSKQRSSLNANNIAHEVASTLNCAILRRMTIKKQKPHTSTRTKASPSTSPRTKKAASTVSKSTRKAKLAKKKAEELARQKRLKKLEQLTLKIFRWAYESNQRGEFQRL